MSCYFASTAISSSLMDSRSIGTVSESGALKFHYSWQVLLEQVEIVPTIAYFQYAFLLYCPMPELFVAQVILQLSLGILCLWRYHNC